MTHYLETNHPKKALLTPSSKETYKIYHVEVKHPPLQRHEKLDCSILVNALRKY